MKTKKQGRKKDYIPATSYTIAQENIKCNYKC